MAEPETSYCLQIFCADAQSHGVWPIFQQKHQGKFCYLSKKDAVVQIGSITHALQVLGITPHTRVAFYAAPSMELWASEWSVLATRSTAVLVPADFTLKELIDTLIETRSRLVFVDTFAIANAIAYASRSLPALKHIICFEGRAELSLPVLSWNDFLEFGINGPDHLPKLLKAIEAEDRALLFYYKDETGLRRGIIYTQAQLLEHTIKIDALLAHQIVAERTAVEIKYKHNGIWRKTIRYAHAMKGDKSYIRNLDAVLAAIPWGHITGHLIAYYISVLKGAAIQVVDDIDTINLPEYRPQVIIGVTKYLDGVRKHITQQVQTAGILKSQVFMRMLVLGKRKYESTEGLNLLQWLEYIILRKIITNYILKLLGGRIRLIIEVDDTARYETKLFFNTFGIEFLEFPVSLLKTEYYR